MVSRTKKWLIQKEKIIEGSGQDYIPLMSKLVHDDMIEQTNLSRAQLSATRRRDELTTG